MTRDEDLTGATEAAWTTFRGRLADHVAQMSDDDVLVVELADVVDDDEIGSAPYVQLCAFGEGLVQVEAAGSTYLHERFTLSDEQEQDLIDLGWEAPIDEPGWENFHQTFECRSADEVAVLLVRTLREVYGVVHPAFLDAAGLEVDPTAAVPSIEVAADDDTGDDTGPSHDEVTMPHSFEHLQDLVDDAMRVVFPDLKKDDEGDIPIRDGHSTAFVRVVGDRPAVEIFAELVLSPADDERLAVELGLLNAAHPLWKFLRVDDMVVMRHELVAFPFVASHLRHVVRLFLDDVDRLAGELVARVGGRRFLDPRPTRREDDAAELPESDLETADLEMTGLLELCHLGRPRAATVAGLFGHDRLEIIRQIVRIRTGAQSCGDHDPDVVLHALRKALRLVSDGEPDRTVTSTSPARPRSVQASLLSDTDVGEDSLDLGWPA